MTQDRRSVAARWLALAVAALGFSGVLAMGVAASRVPILARHITDTDFARRVLVVHVDVGVITWFSAIPVALFHFHRLSAHRSSRTGRAAAIAPWLSTLGSGLLLFGLLPGLGVVQLVNYVPLVVHPLYVAALTLFFAGVAVSYLDHRFLRERPREQATKETLETNSGLPHAVEKTLVAFGGLINLGAIYVLLALVLLGTSLVRLPGGMQDSERLEILMWGPGHVLQFANVAFVLVVWALLAAWGTGREFAGPFRTVPRILALPLLPILGLLAVGPMWSGSRSTFVWLMQWTLFPPVLIFLAMILAPHFKAPTADKAAPGRAALWPLCASIALMLVGFVYGALIRGSDLRIPGHYHANIGAVTLAFMALTLLLPGVAPSAAVNHRVLRSVAVLYGVGQFIFATGLMLSGSYGVGRKALGVEQQVSGGAQEIGLSVMATGGLMAFAGGTAWAVGIARRLWEQRGDHGNRRRLGQ